MMYRVLDADLTFDYSEKQLIEGLVEPTIEMQGDSEDHIREWIVSKPKIGDVLQQSPHDLPIECIG